MIISTLFILLIGVVFLIIAIAKKYGTYYLPSTLFGLIVFLIFVLLTIGFLWVTFVIVAGMSGI